VHQRTQDLVIQKFESEKKSLSEKIHTQHNEIVQLIQHQEAETSQQNERNGSKEVQFKRMEAEYRETKKSEEKALEGVKALTFARRNANELNEQMKQANQELLEQNSMLQNKLDQILEKYNTMEETISELKGNNEHLTVSNEILEQEKRMIQKDGEGAHGGFEIVILKSQLNQATAARAYLEQELETMRNEKQSRDNSQRQDNTISQQQTCQEFSESQTEVDLESLKPSDLETRKLKMAITLLQEDLDLATKKESDLTRELDVANSTIRRLTLKVAELSRYCFTTNSYSIPCSPTRS